MMKRAKYVEPDDYIPVEIRKKLKLGEFAEEAAEEEKSDAKKDVSNEDFRDFVSGKK